MPLVWGMPTHITIDAACAAGIGLMLALFARCAGELSRMRLVFSGLTREAGRRPEAVHIVPHRALLTARIRAQRPETRLTLVALVGPFATRKTARRAFEAYRCLFFRLVPSFIAALALIPAGFVLKPASRAVCASGIDAGGIPKAP